MLSKIVTASLWGLEADLVTVEVDSQKGLPAMNMVGLADTTIKESKERIRAAIQNMGYEFLRRRITINLSPAGTPKEGSHFDLPIAMGILLLDKGAEIPLKETAFIGELSLDGKVRPVRGALPIAIGLREKGMKKLILPTGNLEEVSLLSDMELYPVEDLKQAMQYMQAPQGAVPCRRKRNGAKPGERFTEDFADVVGQENVKRALIVAAAGNHGVLLMGSPGSGKTMMARRIRTIMPEMTYEEQLEVTKIHSVSGLLTERRPAVTQRPFRSPHHTISRAALIGGGHRPIPGEISLAHNGVLFLDEFGQMEGSLLELLRQPVEEESITINRAGGAVTFPSKVMLVAAANPCKCGYLGDDTHACTCTESQLAHYLSKFSGPLVDRIDLHVKVFPAQYERIRNGGAGLSSQKMREQVSAAIEMQQRRYAGAGISFNSRLSPGQVRQYCPLSGHEENLLKDAYEKLGLTMRTYYKIIKIARTIADLEQSGQISTYHIAEALQYRGLEHLYRSV